jgi:hypothetical protein
LDNRYSESYRRLKGEVLFTQGLVWFVAALVSMGNGWRVMAGCYLLVSLVKMVRSATEVVDL